MELMAAVAEPQRTAVEPVYGQTVSLDAAGWRLGIDPHNVGKAERWFTAPRPDARITPVPWIIQDIFPDDHGVVWYWRDFTCPQNADPQGRTLVRFWNVDYLAEVWVNDQYLGKHEGADGPFVLDATEAVHPGATNRLAVRVLNPKDEPIDGIVLNETPHRNKTCAFTFGHDYNHGGIEDSVELLVVPALRVRDLFVRPDWRTGAMAIQVTLHNSTDTAVRVDLRVSVAPATAGRAGRALSLSRTVEPGSTTITTKLAVDHPRRWALDDPFLYRVTANVRRRGSHVADEQSVRCGFRDFRIEHGYFYMNGRRIFLKCSHTGNMAPIGIHLPYERDWFRRDLIDVKAMGFNAIRFISGLPTRQQLDFCDELGLLVYEEPSASWLLQASPHMAERFDRSTVEMIRRDRNHASVVMWGLLNETADGPAFRHAVQTLPLVRKFDDSRLVMLNSGRFDCQFQIGSVANPGSHQWQALLGAEGIQPAEPLKTMYPSCQGAGDAHLYPQVPHRSDAIRLLRSFDRGMKPFFLSEYGVSSPVDLLRVVRQYEQRGKGSCAEARFYRHALDHFQTDWKRWKLADIFGRPEDYFRACLTRMARERLLGINAIRANPLCNGYSLTGTVDQGYSGEGLTTVFREAKPGTHDALRDALAPLRWCLFAEPNDVYRGQSIRVEAILANEDVLAAGDYPVRLEIINANAHAVHVRRFRVTIPPDRPDSLSPLAMSVLDEQVTADWPTGKYRVVATFEQDAAAAGGEAEFYVTDAAEMPAIETEVALWGNDTDLARWLGDHGIRVQPVAPDGKVRRQLIIASGACSRGQPAPAYRYVLKCLAEGSNMIFLTPQLLTKSGLTLPCHGEITGLASGVYHKDDWNRRHPVFAGLPAGGLMDYIYYRNLVPAMGWHGNTTPVDVMAGAMHAAPGAGYASGLLLFADRFGGGLYVVNTLRIRENLGKDPAAERLLRNLIGFASQHLDDPTVALPADFNEQLKQLGL